MTAVIPEGPHAKSVSDVLGSLASDATTGLSDGEVALRVAAFGLNQLAEPPKKSQLVRFLKQLVNPLVLTLLAAAAIAFAVALMRGGAESGLTRFGDAIAILVIVVLDAVLGFVQERKAEAALDALKTMAAPNARVVRGGDVQEIAASALVPGDIVVLQAGDAVPADLRLVETTDASVEEASLTGESTSVAKDASAAIAPDAPLADRITLAFLGTTLVRGKAKGVVVATGARTELGRIGAALSSIEQAETPLELRLRTFGRRILWVCLGTSAALFGWGTIRGHRSLTDLLLEAVSFAVAAIPEGLPAIATITLALGMRRMAKRGAIVRRLTAVETLGAATVICTDKTGTLTRNEMTVRAVFAGGVAREVTGEGYAPVGVVSGAEGSAAIPLLAESAALCNDAALKRDGELWHVVGDPTEGALLALAAKAGRARDALLSAVSVVREVPFDSDRKRMAVVTKRNDALTAHVKGSPDVVVPLCTHVLEDDGRVVPMSVERKRALEAAHAAMTGRALRVLAVARRDLGSVAEDPEAGLTFAGLVGMQDPPREGVAAAIAACRDAGIRVAMITGDHPDTAAAIGREIGLLRPDDDVISGSELAGLDETALAARIARVAIFARTTAEQKLRIVHALKARGDIVAMTGDGVNDAPALREAHIGVAMGKAGTDVARQAADVVLTDDDFTTLVAAVREGRAVSDNIQKFIFFLLSSNMGLAIVVFAVAFFGRGWLPLTPLMILCVNLVTNGLPALALGVDAPDADQMRAPPRRPDAELLGRRELAGIGFVGASMAAAALLVYVGALPNVDGPHEARSLAFSVLAFSPLLHAFSCRSPSASILQMRPLLSWPLIGACALSGLVHAGSVLVPQLRDIYRTHIMVGLDWPAVFLLSFAVVPAVEIAKAFARGFGRRPPVSTS